MPTRRTIEPPANEPGHHPETEQDKPVGRHPRPTSVAAPGPGARLRPTQRFSFRFMGPVGAAARVAVIHESRAFVEVSADTFTARYGPWAVTTALTNIEGASISGPYRWWKVAGPPHLSFADRGLTFATNDERGVCISFREPVVGIEPTGAIRHPGLTVTVDDIEGLVEALRG